MKTIITTLPIYDKLAKQCYQRTIKSGHGLVPITCPRHRLPSFQWADDGDGAGHAGVYLIGKDYDGYEESLVSDWVSHSFDDTFNHTGINITQAKNVGVGGWIATTNDFNVEIGDVIMLRATTAGTSAPWPSLYLSSDGGTYSNVHPFDGAWVATFTVATAGTAHIILAGVGVIDFSMTSFSITRVLNKKDMYWHIPAVPFHYAIEVASGYLTYNGDVLNYLLDPGDYYLQISVDSGQVYYSEWFRVTCVYDNLISEFTNAGLETFTAVDTEITSAINSAGTGYCISDVFSVSKGEIITVVFNLYPLSANFPDVVLTNGATSVSAVSVSGGNAIQLVASWDGDAYIKLDTGALTTNYRASEVMVIREYSTKYLILNFFNSCNLGNILYADGFIQTLWFESETMENTYPQEEEGQKNGENQFIRTFARQVKKYMARTKEMPDYMVDVFNRMKLHDNIEITDLVGDTHSLFNLEVEHEWLWDDKYYAKNDLTFDYSEAVIVGACCENIIESWGGGDITVDSGDITVDD